MFGRDIHTMLRGLHVDRYAFPLSKIQSSQERRFPFRVTRHSGNEPPPGAAAGGDAYDPPRGLVALFYVAPSCRVFNEREAGELQAS